MDILGKTSKQLNKLLDSIVAIVIVLIILFSSYSLYSSFMMFKGAFVSDTLLSMKPVKAAGSDESINFDQIRGINPDVKSWVTVDNTNIDYPVLQGKTNLEYINKNIYGEFAFEGSIFMDVRNKPDFSDSYNLLYGHHMEHGAMFGDLQLFLEKDFFDKNRTGTLTTENGEYKIDFFTVIQADGYDQHVFNPHYFGEKSISPELLDYLDTKKVHSRDIEISADDKIIALSTCTSTQTNGRTILYGVLRAVE